VISEIAAAAALGGKVKGTARRAMTPALALRFILLMTLMPADADYAEVMAALVGDLALVPWQRPYQLPTATVASTWRDALGRAVTVGNLDVGSIDGSLTRVPDTPANREAFGSAGTADDSSPYPQPRELRLGNASTRATPGSDMRPVRCRGQRRPGQERSRAEAAGQGPGTLSSPVHR
jgi:hypothetical protein